MDVKSTKTEFHPGDVLYGKLRPYLDKAILAEFRGVCSTELIVLQADKSRCCPEFLVSLVHTKPFVDHAISTTAGTNLPRTSWNSLQHFRFILPPLTEQGAIAHVLRSVQQAKEATEKVIGAAQELKSSLMRHFFTYGPVSFDQADRVSLKVTEIGPVPDHWKTVPLGDVISVGPQNGLYKHSSAYGKGTPILRINDFENEGSVVTTAPERVDVDKDEIEKFGLQEGDVVINRVNSLSHLGKAALIGRLVEPTVFESNMMRFRSDEGTAGGEYVFRFLTSPPCRRYLRGVAKRAVAQSSINQGDVSRVLLPVAEKDDQRAITLALRSVDEKIRSENHRLRMLEQLFSTLLAKLMTGKVRVYDLVFPAPYEGA